MLLCPSLIYNGFSVSPRVLCRGVRANPARCTRRVVPKGLILALPCSCDTMNNLIQVLDSQKHAFCVYDCDFVIYDFIVQTEHTSHVTSSVLFL
jgi:hypothetical protein